MSTTSFLLVVASIATVEGNLAVIEVGTEHHVQTGDRGLAAYELMVDGVPKRIEVGQVRVRETDTSTVTVEGGEGVRLRPGFQIELRVPADRLSVSSKIETEAHSEVTPGPVVPHGPATVIDSHSLRESLGSPNPIKSLPPVVGENQEPTLPPVVSGAEPADHVPLAALEEPELHEVGPQDIGEDETPESSLGGEADSPLEVPAAPNQTIREMAEIPAGRYLVGLDPPAAHFFNQTPRHEVILSEFFIDRAPVQADSSRSDFEGALTGLSFVDAETWCAELGMRLPTEEEWEVAAGSGEFRAHPGLYEWTDSWYRAYPGNSRVEDEYGELFKVLRSPSDASEEGVFIRRFMRPDQNHSNVGFRCVRAPD